MKQETYAFAECGGCVLRTKDTWHAKQEHYVFLDLNWNGTWQHLFATNPVQEKDVLGKKILSTETTWSFAGDFHNREWEINGILFSERKKIEGKSRVEDGSILYVFMAWASFQLASPSDAKIPAFISFNNKLRLQLLEQWRAVCLCFVFKELESPRD